MKCENEKMNDNGTDDNDKIVRARSLLKKFQSKQHRSSLAGSSEDGSSTPVVPFHLGPNSQDGGDGGGHSRTSSQASSIAVNFHQNNTNNELLTPASGGHEQSQQQQQMMMDRCHSVSKNFNGENAQSMALRNKLGQKQQELNEALSKLQSLHKHYAELHSAYSQLSSEHSALKGSATSAHSEQVHQLRTTLAAALDEKTALQTELRELKMAAATQQHQKQPTGTASTTPEYNPAIYELESRIGRLTAERDHLAETVASQSAQIEHQRRECSGLEAKLVLIQQDRLDTQARIKNLYAEKSQMEKTLEQQRNELAMREIYMRQLARHAGMPEGQQQAEMANNGDGQSRDTQKRLEEELERHKAEAGELRKQLQIVREQHQAASADYASKMRRIEMEMHQLRTTKADLDSSNTFLEEQLRILRIELDNANAEKVSDNGEKGAIAQIDPMEFAAFKQSVASMAAEKQNLVAELREMGRMLEEKEQSIDALTQSLQEAQMRIAQMEQRESIQSTMNTDVALLSDQLQNEKATVSRAVAQNIQLKSQLAELQDRLVQVINDSAAKEDERLSALAAVERLGQELDSAKRMRAQQIESAIIAKEEEKAEIQTDSTHSNEQYQQQHSIMPLVTVADSYHAELVEQSQQTDPSDATDDPDSSMLSYHTLSSDTTMTPMIRTNSNNTIGVQTEPENRGYAPFSTENENVEKQRHHSSSSSSVLPNDDDGTTSAGLNLNDAMASQQAELINQRLEALSQENRQFRANNERLEYWLTALESENESIGEYIALYRFQRGQIQQRIAEKEAALEQFQQQNSQLMAQLVELHNSVLAFLGNSGVQQQNQQQWMSVTPESNGTSIPDENSQAKEDVDVNHQTSPSGSNETGTDGQQNHGTGGDDPMQRLLRALERSKTLGTRATCAAAQQAQIHCTGCVECRGEMWNL